MCPLSGADPARPGMPIGHRPPGHRRDTRPDTPHRPERLRARLADPQPPDPEAPLNTPTVLLAPADLAAVTATVLDNNPGMPEETAGRIVADALAFVATAAAHPGEPIAPSRIVDEGWHALVLHTATYASLCERLGSFVHHYPERPDAARQTSDVLDRTTALMRAAGYTPDPQLWTLPTHGRIPVAAKCGHAPACGVTDPKVTVA